MGNKTSSFRGARGGQPRVPCGGSPLRSQSHRRLTYKSPKPRVHYSSSFCLLGPCPGPRAQCPRWAFPHLPELSLPQGFSSMAPRVCETGLSGVHFVSRAETAFIPLLLFSSSCQEMTMCIPSFPFSSLRLAPAPNNPLSVQGCLLGPLLSKHISWGRILLEQVSRKSVTQEGDSSLMDKDTSLGWRKGNQPCPPLPPPCSLISIKFQSPHSPQEVTEQTCSQVGFMGTPPNGTLAPENQSGLMPGCRGSWVNPRPPACHGDGGCSCHLKLLEVLWGWRLRLVGQSCRTEICM